ncbi:hypothetical protein HPP92_013346 [Vanilla planifolia]|uniref:Uncharacterized protein n=1 Tax=Vanilla planifolia TaxID=51239 RepID=A0A835QUG5_VANPL|nr:hypothetical protein HPP92_013346 [Vanilla planifolia]
MIPCGSVPATLLPSEVLHLPLLKIQPFLKRRLFCNQENGKSHFFSSIPAISSSTSPEGSGREKMRNRVRHRKLNPGEKEGIIEEMRFVTMRLRTASTTTNEVHEVGDSNGTSTWQPTMVGFLSYLVNSKLVFETLETIVEDSTDVSYAYFRRTGLERSVSITKDLEWFQQQGHVIPQPSSHGTAYASHLQRLAEKSAPSFLCHFYNIYFAHIYGGCGIGKQVCEKLLGGRNLEFYKWEGDIQDLLRNVRENINKLAKHWPRSEKNKCLQETAKSFKFSGKIVRLIVLPKLSNN